jgi:hypothetical protein
LSDGASDTHRTRSLSRGRQAGTKRHSKAEAEAAQSRARPEQGQPATPRGVASRRSTSSPPATRTDDCQHRPFPAAAQASRSCDRAPAASPLTTATRQKGVMPSDVSAAHVAKRCSRRQSRAADCFARRNATRQLPTRGDNRVGNIGEVGEGAVVGKAQPLHLCCHLFQLQATIVARGPAARPGLLFRSRCRQPSDRMSRRRKRARQVGTRGTGKCAQEGQESVHERARQV